MHVVVEQRHVDAAKRQLASLDTPVPKARCCPIAQAVMEQYHLSLYDVCVYTTLTFDRPSRGTFVAKLPEHAFAWLCAYDDGLPVDLPLEFDAPLELATGKW